MDFRTLLFSVTELNESRIAIDHDKSERREKVFLEKFLFPFSCNSKFLILSGG